MSIWMISSIWRHANTFQTSNSSNFLHTVAALKVQKVQQRQIPFQQMYDNRTDSETCRETQGIASAYTMGIYIVTCGRLYQEIVLLTQPCQRQATSKLHLSQGYPTWVKPTDSLRRCFFGGGDLRGQYCLNGASSTYVKMLSFVLGSATQLLDWSGQGPEL